MSGVQLSLCPLVASFSDLTTCTPVRLRTEHSDGSENAGRLLDWWRWALSGRSLRVRLTGITSLPWPNGVVAPCPRHGLIAGSGLRRGRADIPPVTSSAMPDSRKLIFGGRISEVSDFVVFGISG